ncbi:integral membrane protein [Truncatella angustata]|uniref:Integral membrane protein n=1 Tax=Truncatella angustata TaxID=152316 RepID=A0A9P8UM93_9PEZI|nr:uncharacterized protein BKA67DRAFT_516589 [Truncatella angustata]KAH6654852.1 integral membrane protein [Truncatella angustata]KAH8197043.1 hypothetical protein TruAng_008794 [Truncatella angustata]
MSDVRLDLPMSMTIAAFTGISWYIGVEINTSLLFLFKRRRGLYFWSCALASWGVILQPLFIILADFGVWKDVVPSITMIYLTWLIMVVPQGWVLYSRLHLFVRETKVLNGIKYLLVFNSIAFSVPTIVIGILAQSTTVNTHLTSFNLIWDRLQLVVFFVQETALSILYIYETRKYLRDSSPLLERPWAAPATAGGVNRAQSNDQKKILRQLIYTNVLIIVLDITLLGIQCADLFYLQGAFKPCVYGIKLKVEFVILNRLINSIQGRSNGETYPRDWIASDHSARRALGHNGLTHKRQGLQVAGENEGVELAQSANGNKLRSHSSESRAPILAA